VAVQAIKRAESGDGWIIRLREVGGKAVTATITLPAGKFKRAWACNLVEDSQSELQLAAGKIEVAVKANGMATVLVQ
jgi:alpha-mannosidase